MKRLISIQQYNGKMVWIHAILRRVLRVQFWLAIVLSFWFSWTIIIPDAWAMGGKQPPVGEPAPEFLLSTNTGDGDISLKDYRGQWVVLYFYPKDDTPGCTKESCGFNEALQAFKSLNTASF